VYLPYRMICWPTTMDWVVFVMSVPDEPPRRIVGVTGAGPLAETSSMWQAVEHSGRGSSLGTGAKAVRQPKRGNSSSPD
jgi:hypothetical protein